jgi:hypothetical protein
MSKPPTSAAFVYEALGLKAASSAIEKTMLDLLKSRDLSGVDKLIALKNLYRHQSDIEKCYLYAMSQFNKDQL